MNIFYLKVELITLCSVLAYFYVALKHFNASGNYISKQLSFLAHSFALIFMGILYEVLGDRLYGAYFLKQIVSIVLSVLAVMVLYRMYLILRDISGSKCYILISSSILILGFILFIISKHEYQLLFSALYSIIIIILAIYINYKMIKSGKRIDIGALYITLATVLTFLMIMIHSGVTRESIFALVYLLLKIILIVSILTFFNKAQKILKDKTDDYNFQNKKLTQAEIKILKLAYVDPVTEIPNIIAFQKDFDDKRHLNDKRIILLVNLDNFKFVNNIIGFTKGNEYLKRVAQLISEAANSTDKIYSMNGDRFAIIHYGDESTASNLAIRVIDKLNRAQDLVVKHYKMGASIGISNISADHDYNKTIKEVEIALLEVKNNGKNNYLCYNSKLDDIYENKLMLENKLELAIKRNEFQMYFQPQLDLKTSKIVGVEALIRWIDKDGNFISPEEFIPLAERTGKMNRISKFIMNESLKKLRLLIDSGFDDVKMSINVSAVEIFEDGFVSSFMKKINKYSLDASMVNIEITETSLIENIELASSIFKELRSYDISISLDDFGVGYSSLNYFSKFPISEVKFDKSFTSDLLYSKKNEIILKHFTALSHTLGISVVIEGVENSHQLAIIEKLACDKYQGYLYSKPLAFDKLIDLLIKNSKTIAKSDVEIS